MDMVHRMNKESKAWRVLKSMRSNRRLGMRGLRRGEY